MKREDTKFIFASFFTWRVFLLLFVVLGATLFSLQSNFLGGGLENYLKNPYFWGFINFDGEHYLSIALQGYQSLTYFYFPLYPLITRAVALLLGGGFVKMATSGLLVSNISFIIALFGFWKLLRLDYKRSISQLTILILLLFPTSFYFVSYYTEGLTFALIIWSFYFLRKRNWLLAGILGGVATATRITALALLPAFLYEIWAYRKENKNLILPFVSFLLIPLGLGLYMYYLYRGTGDPLEFFNTISIFGAQRSSNLVLLPQVFYRYFFKVLPNLTYSYFPVVFTTYLEIVSAIVFLLLGIWTFFKLRLSYALYFAAGYLIPPLSGSFSSFPRYVLILFPGFILLALWLNKKTKIVKSLVYIAFFVLLSVACALFVRGYWIS